MQPLTQISSCITYSSEGGYEGKSTSPLVLEGSLGEQLMDAEQEGTFRRSRQFNDNLGVLITPIMVSDQEIIQIFHGVLRITPDMLERKDLFFKFIKEKPIVHLYERNDEINKVAIPEDIRKQADAVHGIGLCHLCENESLEDHLDDEHLNNFALYKLNVPIIYSQISDEADRAKLKVEADATPQKIEQVTMQISNAAQSRPPIPLMGKSATSGNIFKKNERCILA